MRAGRLAPFAVLLAAAAGGAFLVLQSPGAGTTPGRTTEEVEASAEPRLVGAPRDAGDEDASRLLARLAANDGADDVRARIAERAARDDDFVAHLVWLLSQDEAAWEREGLGRWGPWLVLNALVEAGRPAALPLYEIAADPTHPLHEEALDALVRMGPPASVVVERVLEHWSTLEDVSHQARWMALFQAIGPDASAALPVVLPFLGPPVDDDLAPYAAQAAVAIAGASPDVLETLQRALLDEETAARPDILSALWELGPEARPLLPLLIELAEDPEGKTRRMAASVLGQVGVASPDVIRVLAHAVEDGETWGKYTASAALAALGDQGAGTLLELARTAEDVDDRLSAFGALRATNVDQAAHVDILLDILDEPVERSWKMQAIYLISGIRPPPPVEQVLPALERALDDTRLADAACRTLLGLGDERARTVAVGHIVRDPDLLSRYSQMLAQMGVDRVTLGLQLLAAVPEETGTMRRASMLRSVVSLGVKLPAEKALDAISAEIASENVSIAANAVMVLARIEGADAEVERLLAAASQRPEAALRSAAAWVRDQR